MPKLNVHLLRNCWTMCLLLLTAACRPLEVYIETRTPLTALAVVTLPPTTQAATLDTALRVAESDTPPPPPATSGTSRSDTPTPEFTLTSSPKESTPVSGAALPTSTDIPHFTPLPNWYRFASDRFAVQFQYPSHWQPEPVEAIRFSGSDGFFELSATNSQDNALWAACHDMVNTSVYGSDPTLKFTTAAEQEACLILPSADQGTSMRGQAALIVRYPQLMSTIVPGVDYAFLIVWADDQHIRTIKDTLEFLPAATLPTATSTPTPVECVHEWFFANPAAYACPTAPPINSQAATQRFEHGRMVWVEATDVFYIFFDSDGQTKAPFRQFGQPFALKPGASVDNRVGETPPPGFYEPVSGFGLLWRGEVEGAEDVRPRLGWAVEPEYGYQAAVQCGTTTSTANWSCYLRGPLGEIINFYSLTYIGLFWDVWG